MSQKSADNLRQYEAAKAAAREGNGTVVTVVKLRQLLVQHVAPEYDAFDDAELLYQAEGGGYIVRTEHSIFLLPLYDRDENLITVSF